MRVKTEQKRQEILDIAAEIFEAKGFEGASMSAIAAKVGGSKGTLYNYFSSKEELFIEVMLSVAGRHKKQLEQCACNVSDDGDIEEALGAFGKAYITFITQPWFVDMYRAILGFKEAAAVRRDFYEKGPGRGRAKMAEMMRAAMHDGRLRKGGDPVRMALQFKSLLEAECMQPILLDAIKQPGSAQITAWVGHAVDAFMALYGPRGA